MNHFDKIRTFIDLMRSHAIAVAYGRQLYAADTALAELERAASVPVAEVVQGDGFRYLIWGELPPAGTNLYTTPPPAPVASLNDRQRLEAIIEVLDRYLPPDAPLTEHEAMNEIIGLVDPLPPAPVAAPHFDAVKLTDEVCNKIFDSWARLPDKTDDYSELRQFIAAVRAELGPTLGLAVMREPTTEECERICTAYFVDKTPASHVMPLGSAMFNAVRDVMWPKEGL